MNSTPDDPKNASSGDYELSEEWMEYNRAEWIAQVLRAEERELEYQRQAEAEWLGLPTPTQTPAPVLVQASPAEEAAIEQARITLAGETLPSPALPMDVAHKVLEKYQDDDGNFLLRYWRGGWWRYCGTHWRGMDREALDRELRRVLEKANYRTSDGNMAPWAPNNSKIAELINAMASVAEIPDIIEANAWLAAPGTKLPLYAFRKVTACLNGLVDLETRELHPHTPAYFGMFVLPFAFDATAAEPLMLFGLLKQWFPNDAQAIDLTQEWFGYVVSGATNFQKMLVGIGPTRSGKGVLSRLLTSILGSENVVGLSMAEMGGGFGMQPALGKSLGIIGDARIPRAGKTRITETLLNVIGEDAVQVNRKKIAIWTGRLPLRFMMMSNELPDLPDSSNALTTRMLFLRFTQSFVGREDPTLDDKLKVELPGIFLWALDGLARLQERGRFTAPESGEKLRRQMEEIASPVSAFLASCCTVGAQHTVPKDSLFGAWKNWCEDHGYPSSNSAHFARQLYATVPRLEDRRLRLPSGARPRVWCGLKLGVTEPEEIHSDAIF